MTATSFEDLEVFQKAYKISLEIHKFSLTLPQIEQYAIADQIRRASKSVGANIVEGFAKQVQSRAEFRRYIFNAMGSSDEMRMWTRYCLDLSYINEETWKRWNDEYRILSKMLFVLAKKLGE